MRALPPVLALLCASGAAAQTVPPPLPKPETQHHFSNRGRINIESYRLDPATAPVPPPTVAQRRYIANRLGRQAEKPFDIIVACWIRPSGEVSNDCAPDTLFAYPAINGKDIALGNLPKPAFPIFPALTDRRPKARRVEYAFHFDGEAPAPVDWNRGALVDRTLIPPIAGSRWIAYPLRALAARKEAKATIECQVQDDRSVVCRTLSILPAESASFFSDVGEYQFVPGAAPAALADGSSSIGAHARFEIDFRLPD